MYSKVHFEYPLLQGISIKSKIKEYALFGEHEECLVLLLDCEEIEELHSKIMSNNPEVTYDFEQYIPHVTLSANFKGEFPNILPPFELVFDKLYSEDLDD